MKKVMFVCRRNSCRSQMAEALWQDLGQGEWEAYSAGSKPAGYVHPMAIQVMSDGAAVCSIAWVSCSFSVNYKTIVFCH